MSSSPVSFHPPYAAPSTSVLLAATTARFDAFAAPMSRQVPYVPPDARLGAATAMIDAPVAAPLVSGARLDTLDRLSVVGGEEEHLPSIDQFLAEAPSDGGVSTMAALFSAPGADIEAAAEDALRPSVAPEVSGSEEPWAIADATGQVAELAEGLVGRNEPIDAGVLEAPSEPLEPWTDDEHWMDIMPALQTPGGPDLAGETAWARAFAEPPAPLTPAPLATGDTEAAASSLEAIARRLRAGELEIPGYRGDRGDAAALAAALAALLSAGH